MEATALLEREARFRQMNRELERRTKGLLHQIETAMQKQDSFADIFNITFGDNRKPKIRSCESSPKSENTDKLQSSFNTTKYKGHKHPPSSGKGPKNNASVEQSEATKVAPCCCLDEPNKRDDQWEFLEAFISINVRDDVLPKSFLQERPSGESLCKFLASKTKLIQEQVDKLQLIVEKKAAQCEQHLSSRAELEGERLQLVQRADNLRLQSERNARRAAALQMQLDECSRRYMEVRGEADRLSGELARARSRCAAAEARAAPLDESVARLRKQVEALTAADKEFRSSTRAHAAAQQEALASHERRRRALTAALERRARLADNLRRQNALLAAGAALRGLEDDYSALLAGED